jgi:hypothetical protein
VLFQALLLSVEICLLLVELTTGIVGYLFELLRYWTDHLQVFFNNSCFILSYRARATSVLTTFIAEMKYSAHVFVQNYRNTNLSESKCRRLATYLIPVLITSVLLNLPKFLETTVEYDHEEGKARNTSCYYQKVNYANWIASCSEERKLMVIQEGDIRGSRGGLYAA